MRFELVQTAIWDAARHGKLDNGTFLEQLTNRESEYLRRPLSNFKMLSSVSVWGVVDKPRKRWLGGVLLRNPGRLGVARKVLDEDIRHYVPFPLPTFYQSVIVEIKARERHAAFEIGLARLDLARAIWNFFYNRQYVTRETFGVPKRINEIVLGPIHTLHDMTGKLATESFHYEPDYTGPVDAFNWSSQFAKLSSFFVRVERRLLVHPERQLIENALVDYVRALDIRDSRQAFVALWSLLERLIGSKDPTESKKLTVKRASFFFPADHEYASAVLKRLLERRNELAHGRKDIPNLDWSLHHTRRFVETAIEFLLDNKYAFRSHNDFLDFLVLPKDLRDVSRRLKLLAQAKSHLQPPRDRKRVTQPKSSPA